MLTPRFQLTQDDQFLFVTIYAPFTNLESTEIFMDGCDFRFFSKPYYLRLHLPGEVEESDEAGGEYLADTASFRVKCPKVHQGEHFQGLDMITQLLTPKGESQVKNLVEDITDQNKNRDEPPGDQKPEGQSVPDGGGQVNEDGGEEDDEDEVGCDWYIDQQVPAEEDHNLTITETTAVYGYGFNFRRTGVFKTLLDEFGQLLDVKDPDSKTLSERREEREKMENCSFDGDHYLYDLYESADQIDHILNYNSEWEKLLDDNKQVDPHHPRLAFSPAEQEQMISLPRTVHRLEERERVPVFFTMLDILYARAYDERINEGEETCESGWCVAKLSPSLSSCTKNKSLKDTVISCIRRSLIYPLFRHWELSLRVWKDVVCSLRVGKVAVIKSFLKVMKCFGETEGYYILSQLYIQDYLTWLQSVPESHLTSLADALNSVIKGVTKSDVNLELEDLEHAAELTIKEQQQECSTSNNVDLITSRLDKVDLDSDDDSDDSSTSSSDDDDDDESDSDDSDDSSDAENSDKNRNKK